MKFRGIPAVAAATILAAGTASVVATPGAVAAARGQGPRLSMLAVTQTVTAYKFKNQPVYFDPDIWVESAGSDLRIDVQRTSYTSPATVTQLISTPWGTTEHRTLPGWVNDNFNGLKDFIHLSIRNSHGKRVVSQPLTFCPDSYSPERATLASANTDPYPQQCGSFDPFPVGDVWGIPRGWAVDPFQSFFGTPLKLAVGRYRVIESVTARYRKLFGIPAGAASASVRLHVVGSPFAIKRPSDARRATSGGPLGSLPHVRTMNRPPQAALPQLTALPSWGISTSKQSHHDYLNFGATVWVGGNSPLDVQGFAVKGSSLLRAYQYFWRNGKVIGRARVGTMNFDTEKGHNHWHFEQFAQYRLLTAAKKLAVRSEKVGFCIAPTDSVDLALRHAVWQQSFLGFGGGQCGVPGALWVQEYLPVGWGDTYDQYKAGQAFDITNLPNGTYYIEVIANPLHKLHELSSAGNTSLRKVIIGGTKGHRTVRVPAWNGIDPES